MVYTENSSAQAGACNANLGLTVAPVWAGARADDNPTRILQRRNSHLEPAPFSFPKDRRPVKLDAALITYTVTRAEQTTGRTRELWLALFRLLCQWWVER
jgi:hypothetical protein